MHVATMPLVVDQTLTIVSRSQLFVRSGFMWPAQRSTTAAPSTTTEIEAPTSPCVSTFSRKASSTVRKRGVAVAFDVYSRLHLLAPFGAGLRTEQRAGTQARPYRNRFRVELATGCSTPPVAR